METMIALFLLMVGLLALAGLQARALVHARQAEVVSLLNREAESIAEIARLLPSGQIMPPLSGTVAQIPGEQGCEATQPCSSSVLLQQRLHHLFEVMKAAGVNPSQLNVAICPANLASPPRFSNLQCATEGMLSVRLVWLMTSPVTSKGSATGESEYAVVVPVRA